MSIKFTHSPSSAYEIAVGITAKEAEEAGLAVMEWTCSTNPPQPIFGRYKDAPDGAALGITMDKPGATIVVGGGGAPAGGLSGPDKGSLVNRNDPFVHGGTGDESVHKDGAEPPVRDFKAEENEMREVAEKSIEDASKARRGK